MEMIYKYPLRVTDEQDIEMPQNAVPLTVQDQHATLTLWVLVDTEQPTRARTIHIVGTGHPLPTVHGSYIGTVQQRSLVWHVFDMG